MPSARGSWLGPGRQMGGTHLKGNKLANEMSDKSRMVLALTNFSRVQNVINLNLVLLSLGLRSSE
jgi:hypothetical protein